MGEEENKKNIVAMKRSGKLVSKNTKKVFTTNRLCKPRETIDNLEEESALFAE